MAAKSCGSAEVTGTLLAWSEGTCPGRCRPLHSTVSTGVPTTLSRGPLQRPGEAGLILLLASPPVKVGSRLTLNAFGLKLVMLVPRAYVGVVKMYRTPS